MIRSKKLRDSARGEECTLRLSICNGNPETVVLCHLPSASHGMGLKSPDWWAIYSCSSCHDRLDNRRMDCIMGADDILRALHETQCRMIDKGLIMIKGAA